MSMGCNLRQSTLERPLKMSVGPSWSSGRRTYWRCWTVCSGMLLLVLVMVVMVLETLPRGLPMHTYWPGEGHCRAVQASMANCV
jgi:hypothetical protein